MTKHISAWLTYNSHSAALRGTCGSTDSTTSPLAPSDSTASKRIAGEHEALNAHRYVDVGETLDFSNAQIFLPTLQEMDSSQPGQEGKGARETIAWLHGMRSFKGHPLMMWRTPEMVLKQFGTVHGWAIQLLVHQLRIPKKSSHRL